MTKSSLSDNMQDERLIQELRNYQRAHPSNKRCFDCNEMMPQYICLDFNTFVCTACSGIHREFAHRVKSISMSKFTESEVKNMINHGGNEAAQKHWRSKHDPSFRPNGGSDGERTRNFIRLTYIDRKWVNESPRHAKDEGPVRKSKSSKKKEKNSKSDDNVSSSLKSVKPITESGFDDFSNFKGSSRTAATVQSFGDFGNFDSPAPEQKTVEGFADFGNFGDFGGSSAAQKSKSKTPSPLPVPKFGSFKIAPPPGLNVSTYSVNTVPGSEYLMGLSPPTQADSPFGLDDPAPTIETSSQSSPVVSSPFDFDDPTPASCAGNCPDSAFLDPFSNMAATVPSTPVSAPHNILPFDAFSAPNVSSHSVFDALTAPSPASTTSSNVFDAFGGGGDAFGELADSNSSLSANLANPVLDPFASTPEKPDSVAATADPFAAFDGMQPSSSEVSTLGSAALTTDIEPPKSFPAGNYVSQQQAAMKDPFGFGCGTGNNSGIPVPQQQQHHPGSYVTNQLFVGSLQQQQPQNVFGHQVHQHQNAFVYQMQQQPMLSFVQGQPLQNQQQRYGRQQGFPGQQHTMQFFPHQASGTSPAPTAAKTLASASSINDPFASLNIGNLGFDGFSDTTATRTSSGGAALSSSFAPANESRTSSSFKNAPTSPGSISYAQPKALATASFPLSQQNTAAFTDPNVFADFASVPAPAQTSVSPANPFDMF